ncbi:MAG: aminodeoxychorismate synthase component I [bacterium]
MKLNKISEIINFVINNFGSAFFYTPPIYKNAQSILFTTPVKYNLIYKDDSILEKFQQIENFYKNKYIGYAILNYELGYKLESKFEPLLDKIKKEEPLGKFVFFNKKGMIKFDSKKIEYDFNSKSIDTKPIINFKLNTNKIDYINNVKIIKDYISQGYTYQVNYTVKGKFTLNKNLVDLFGTLIFNQSAKYTAIINRGDKIIISISPELFFKFQDKEITVTPMKGTIKRGYNRDTDKTNKAILLKSKKENAENLMIVDLMRNDIGRVSKFGSVKVKKMFKIEKYESLFQMVSTIKSKLVKPNLTKILTNIFPCGSITGAPKIKTMQIIDSLEKEPRGVYTGGIGIIKKNSIIFNVAIRTLVIDKKTNTGEIGLGSGIVWDSTAEEEYKEVKLKGNYLTKPEKYFELFESILVENKIPYLLEEHLLRLRKASDYFLFYYNKKELIKEINKAINNLDNKQYKLKIVLNKWGKINTFVEQLNNFAEPIKVIIAEKNISSINKFQYFKTTNRIMYDRLFKLFRKKGFYDVLFFNQNNQVAEGSFNNILIKKDNAYFTPPITAGVLNGIYRAYLLKTENNVFEKQLSIEDIKFADEIYLINSVRKKVKIDEIYLGDEKIFECKKQ